MATSVPDRATHPRAGSAACCTPKKRAGAHGDAVWRMQGQPAAAAVLANGLMHGCCVACHKEARGE